MTPADITDRLKVIRDTAEDEFTHDTVDAAIARIAELEGALKKIERWEMPRTGKYHHDGREQSYAFCYGSNGERDVIRNIARAALAAKEAK